MAGNAAQTPWLPAGGGRDARPGCVGLDDEGPGGYCTQGSKRESSATTKDAKGTKGKSEAKGRGQ